jgi:hypothetical protein
MVRFDRAANALPRLLSVDVPGIQILTDVVPGLKFGVDGASHMGLNHRNRVTKSESQALGRVEQKKYKGETRDFSLG